MISVVIPALNSASTISFTLSSIFSNSLSRDLFEVLVVDNGSSDKTVEIAERFPAKVFHCSKKGIGPARNFGISGSKGSIVCLTDSDCIVEKDWLERIFDSFDQNPELDGVGGPVFPYPCDQSKIQRLTGELFVDDQGYPKRIKKVRFGSKSGIIFGSNCAYKKEALLSVGCFSEPGGSNLELAWRLAFAGRSVYFDPGIRVCHIFPVTLKSVMKQQFRWGAQATNMARVHHVYNGLKEFVVISYFLVRRLMSLIVPEYSEKKLLHTVQLTSYSAGRIYGRDV
jgi:glycosyltransferase involved in cell wall biosynthesis